MDMVAGLGSWMVTFLEPMVSFDTRMMGHMGSGATKKDRIEKAEISKFYILCCDNLG